jgi:hypothetical protein
METVVHEVFGAVECDSASELNVWESQGDLAGRRIELDMSFDGAVPPVAELDALARYVTDLAVFDETARAAMRADLAEEESAVRDYLEHHDFVDEDAFLAELRLSRVGLYAGQETGECQAVFDYTIDTQETQYLVVVKFDDEAAVFEICMES